MAHTDHKSTKCLTPPFNKKTDGRLRMRFNGGITYASRIMCWLAHGAPPTPKHVAAHKCGKGHEACVNPNHLYWATRRENMHDKIKHGTLIKGSAHPQAKLSENAVRIIREKHKQGVEQKDLALHYGVCRSVVCEAVSGKTWSHVK